jgi:hypothetical protein
MNYSCFSLFLVQSTELFFPYFSELGAGKDLQQKRCIIQRGK